jgi:hypothetical protein
MSQLVGPDQGPSLGRRQRLEVQTPAEIHPGVRRFPRTGINSKNTFFIANDRAQISQSVLSVTLTIL